MLKSPEPPGTIWYKTALSVFIYQIPWIRQPRSHNSLDKNCAWCGLFLYPLNQQSLNPTPLPITGWQEPDGFIHDTEQSWCNELLKHIPQALIIFFGAGYYFVSFYSTHSGSHSLTSYHQLAYIEEQISLKSFMCDFLSPTWLLNLAKSYGIGNDICLLLNNLISLKCINRNWRQK